LSPASRGMALAMGLHSAMAGPMQIKKKGNCPSYAILYLNLLHKLTHQTKLNLQMSMSREEKTFAQCVQEDRALHAAEDAAWNVYLQKERAEYQKEEAEKAQRKAEKRARRTAAESLSVSHATDKTLAQCVQEDRALHAAENAAWYAYLQKEREEEAQRQAEKDARRAARRAAKEGLADKP